MRVTVTTRRGRECWGPCFCHPHTKYPRDNTAMVVLFWDKMSIESYLLCCSVRCIKTKAKYPMKVWFYSVCRDGLLYIGVVDCNLLAFVCNKSDLCFAIRARPGSSVPLIFSWSHGNAQHKTRHAGHVNLYMVRGRNRRIDCNLMWSYEVLCSSV